MNKKLAYKMGRKAGMVKFAKVLKARDPRLVKLARALAVLERKGKLTKEAADKAFEKSAGLLGGLGLAGLGAAGAYAAPKVWQGLKGFWGGLTGGGAKPGAATAETGAAGAEGADKKPLPTGFGPATPEGTLKDTQMMHGYTPQQLSTRNQSNEALMNRMNQARRGAAQSRALYAM